MRIDWKLRMAAAQREVWTGAQLRRLLAEKAGLELSSASVSALLTKEPSQIKLSTLIALCTALECTPNDLFEVDTTPVQRPGGTRAARGGATESRCRAGSFDATDLSGDVRDGQDATRLRGLWRAGGVHRPGVLLPVHARVPGGGGEGTVPGLRAGSGPARGHRAVRAVLPPLHRMRRPGPGPGRHRVPAVPAQGRAGSREGPLPRCGQARVPAGRDRLVRVVFQTRTAEGTAPDLRDLRRTPPARRRSGCAPCAGRRHPDRAEVRGEHLIAELADPPLWVPDFVAFLAGRHCPSRAATMIGILARLLADEHPNDPQAVLDRARRPGRSIGSLARGLQDFFTERRLAPPTDHPERLAAGRRQRRIDATPQALRPAVQAFAASLLQNRQRARAAATRPRTDHTIEAALRTCETSLCS